MGNILTDKRSAILAELRSEMNGAVVESMLKYNGNEPFFSYGVSLPRIKQEALKYKGDHELALLLFESEIRELKLAAIYTETPENVTRAQMEQWSGSFHSPEIADNAATMLFFAADDATATAAEWLGTDNLIRPALMMIGKRARAAYREAEREVYGELLKQIIPLTKKEQSRGTMDAVSYALSSLHRLFPKEVEAIAADDTTTPYIAATIMY